MPHFSEMHANRLNAIGMDTSTPLMRLCRRQVRESYCTGNLMTQLFMFFSFCHDVHAGMGHASFLEGEGYRIECNSWTLYSNTQGWMTGWI